MAIRWAKQPGERGLARIVQTPRGWELRENGKVQMRVSPVDRQRSAWYWYGHGVNTFEHPVDTVEEAKSQAEAHYRAVRLKEKENHT